VELIPGLSFDELSRITGVRLIAGLEAALA